MEVKIHPSVFQRDWQQATIIVRFFLPTKNRKATMSFQVFPPFLSRLASLEIKRIFPLRHQCKHLYGRSLCLPCFFFYRPPSPFHVHTNVEGKEEGKGEVQVCLHIKQSNTFFTPPLRSSLSLEICLLFLLFPCRGKKVE